MNDLKVNKGSRLSAKRHNSIVDLASRRTGGGYSFADSIGNFFRQLTGTQRGLRLRVKEIKPKFLKCVAVEGIEGIGNGIVEDTEIIKVAKPYTLRDLSDYDGVTFSNYSSDAQEKTATIGATVETHVINPKWVVDCEIIADFAPVGGSGVVDTTNNNEEILLVCSDNDGRQWAKVE